MVKVQTYITNALLVFVLVSIGFILGKHNVVNTTPNNISVDNGDKLIVYYLHSSFRCETCNSIENMTKSLLDSLYTPQLKSGAIVWQEVDFQQDETLAKSFKVAASCVVVAHIKQGETTRFKKLDDVWDKIHSPDEFNSYINTAITEYLQ